MKKRKRKEKRERKKWWRRTNPCWVKEKRKKTEMNLSHKKFAFLFFLHSLALALSSFSCSFFLKYISLSSDDIFYFFFLVRRIIFFRCYFAIRRQKKKKKKKDLISYLHKSVQRRLRLRQTILPFCSSLFYSLRWDIIHCAKKKKTRKMIRWKENNKNAIYRIIPPQQIDIKQIFVYFFFLLLCENMSIR